MSHINTDDVTRETFELSENPSTIAAYADTGAP